MADSYPAHPQRKGIRSPYSLAWGIVYEVLSNLSPSSCAQLIFRVARRLDDADKTNHTLGATLETLEQLIRDARASVPVVRIAPPPRGGGSSGG